MTQVTLKEEKKTTSELERRYITLVYVAIVSNSVQIKTRAQKYDKKADKQL